MNYWLLCLPREDIEQCMRVKTFGLTKKHVLGRVRVGDGVVCCAGKGDWKVIASGKATSEHYLDLAKIFHKEGTFPDRIDFSCNKVLPKESEVDLMTLLDRLSFVKNLAYWAVFFRNGIVQMAKSDWDLIISQIDRADADI